MGCTALALSHCKNEDGPGGDDDRPITMSEGSFRVRWVVRGNPEDNGWDPDGAMYRHSGNAAANLIDCKLPGGEFSLGRKAGKPLIVAYTVDVGGSDLILQLATKKNGKHGLMPLVREFQPGPSANELQLPSAKIKSVAFHNVELASGPLPIGFCIDQPAAGRVVCTPGSAAMDVTVHVCRNAKNEHGYCTDQKPRP